MSVVKKSLVLMFALGVVFPFGFLFSACLWDGVVPCAWTYLKMDGGYYSYSSDMYGMNGDHIYYYLNEEDVGDVYKRDISIKFYPRIMGHDDEVIDGKSIKTTIVDISKYSDLSFYVSTTSPLYSVEKRVYINGQKIDKALDVYDSFATILIQDLNLQRGNPNGQRNDVVNIIEYK